MRSQFNYLLIAALLLSSVFLMSDCGKKGGTRKIEQTTQKTEPQFKKEGVLTFFDNSDTTVIIDIEIADNNRERMQGMMYRTSMDFNKGMLFIFDYEEEQSFWMKNTKMALDIMYVNSDNEIVSLYKHTPPYSESPIPSLEPAIYVIETAAGFCDKFKISVGNTIEFQRILQPV